MVKKDHPEQIYSPTSCGIYLVALERSPLLCCCEVLLVLGSNRQMAIFLWRLLVLQEQNQTQNLERSWLQGANPEEENFGGNLDGSGPPATGVVLQIPVHDLLKMRF